MSGVQVAVRIRPFNTREIKMNSTCCMTMEGPQTTITNPENGKPKTFAFDYSYWSHDQFHEDEQGFLVGDTPHYATQRMVFDDLGQSVLNNAFQGFNCSLFAYGQTGAGKSFSMVGYGVNKGIIPITCDELFKRVETSTTATEKFEVYVSMLEIYNEAIGDLFTPGAKTKGGLKVREKKGIGVYVDGLSKLPVRDYAEVEARMEEGTKNRTVAATQMNATSSRAHTVFTLTFKQITIDPANPKVQSVKESNINLVDLAGSERADSTGATGDRLKEGCAINQSLSALGNVISALADKAQGKKGVFIPYRSSKLTRLLQDALGGNSKTIMIAALSPASVNYDETLSTLQYADRAKKIKNNAVVNENPTDKMIRQLKEENARLLKLLEGKGIDTAAGDGGGDGGAVAGSDAAKKLEEAHKKELERTINENNSMMEEMRKTWEQKLAEVQSSGGSSDGSSSLSSASATKLPHLVNLHEDPLLSECVVYAFKEGHTRIGRANAATPQDVTLNGLNIRKEHAVVENIEGVVMMRPVPGAAAKVFVNGDLVREEHKLSQGDRVILGNNFIFRFMDPGAGDIDESSLIGWEVAMEELAKKQGFRTQQQGVGDEVSKLEEEERKMLEEKIKEMEEMMEKERAVASVRLEQQRKILMEQGGANLSEEEVTKMMASQADEMKAKEEEMAQKMEEQRELTKKIVQDQMKRKRQTRKIEEELGRLMPMVNDANSMAEELGKHVRFEAKLRVCSPNVLDLDELKQLKTIETVVKMTHQETKNVWTWTYEKFESRLFMMRDLYAAGEGGAVVDRANDPFWDPPEPIEIGKAYVYMKALAHLVEIENDFTIVNYKGEDDGNLRVEIFPHGPHGEELDYLQGGSAELEGQSVGWTLKIPSATGIPEAFSFDVFATLTFLEKQISVPPFAQRSTSPKFDFEADIPASIVTKDVCHYFETEPIVIALKGFREKQEKIGPSTLTAAGVEDLTGLCTHCEEQTAFFSCGDCGEQLCIGCDDLLHMAASKATHHRTPIQDAVDAANAYDDASGSAGATAGTGVCDQCEEQAAAISCVECGFRTCAECDDFLHMAPSKKTHTRVGIAEGGGVGAIAGGTAASLCQMCEEKPPSFHCTECEAHEQNLCDECNEFLHMSPAKAAHQRIAVGGAAGSPAAPPAAVNAMAV